MILENLTDEKYKDASVKLNITKSEEIKESKKCMICHEEHNKILKLECGHYLCLENSYGWFKNKTKRCMYCNKSFEWTDCTAYELNLEVDIDEITI